MSVVLVVLDESKTIVDKMRLDTIIVEPIPTILDGDMSKIMIKGWANPNYSCFSFLYGDHGCKNCDPPHKLLIILL